MRFQVPQFIEIESKIFGPLTLKQFIYLLGGAGIIFLLYVILPIWLMIPLAIPVAAFSLALAFYKINNRPLITILDNAVKYFLSPRIYLWKKEKLRSITSRPEIKKESSAPQIYIPKLTQNKLRDLSWSLDIKETIK